MIPILYDKYETDFLSNGLGQLGDCLTCTVTEEVNGIYELEFTYPMSGAYYEQLINAGGVVACTHDHNGDIQLFDIYKYSAPIDGIVTFYGSHVSYRLGFRLRGYNDDLDGIPRTSVDLLFYAWNRAWMDMFPATVQFQFTDYSGLSGGRFRAKAPYIVRDAMFNTSDEAYNLYEQGSVLQLWKGEWAFDNFNVSYYKKRGTNRGVQIRYGKNMTAVQRERDTYGIVSAVVVYCRVFDQDLNAYISREVTVQSPQTEHDLSPWDVRQNQRMYCNGEEMLFQPAIIRPILMDISSEYQTLPSPEEMRKIGLEYMSKNSTWRANDNITVNFLDLYDTPEYENIRGLSDCRIGDFVSILYPQLGIVSDGIEIMSLTYDVLAERVTEMQLNTIRTTLAQVIIDSIGGKT